MLSEVKKKSSKHCYTCMATLLGSVWQLMAQEGWPVYYDSRWILKNGGSALHGLVKRTICIVSPLTDHRPHHPYLSILRFASPCKYKNTTCIISSHTHTFILERVYRIIFPCLFGFFWFFRKHFFDSFSTWTLIGLYFSTVSWNNRWRFHFIRSHSTISFFSKTIPLYHIKIKFWNIGIHIYVLHAYLYCVFILISHIAFVICVLFIFSSPQICFWFHC